MQEPKQESNKPEYVYLIEAVGSGWVKIGRSNDPFGRMESFQTGCPYPLVLKVCFHCGNAVLVEGRLHELCKAHRGQGEWFEIDSLIVRALLNCQKSIASGTPVFAEDVLALSDHNAPL